MKRNPGDFERAFDRGNVRITCFMHTLFTKKWGFLSHPITEVGVGQDCGEEGWGLRSPPVQRWGSGTRSRNPNATVTLNLQGAHDLV